MSESTSLLSEGPFAGREAFAQLIRDALQQASIQGWRKMVWCDANFEDWPLHEKTVFDSLQAWAQSGRQLVMLARTFDYVQKHQARMVNWRTTWGHIVECRVNQHLDASDFPSVLWTPQWAMQRLEMEHSTGHAGTEPQRRIRLQEQLQELQKQS
ncbi:MAG: hypothetical protein ACOVOD_01430, partial [Rhodoferax sp.]